MNKWARVVYGITIYALLLIVIMTAVHPANADSVYTLSSGTKVTIPSSYGIKVQPATTALPVVRKAPVAPSVVVSRLPGDSALLLPILKSEIDTYWPDIYLREFPAGVIDQESNWKMKAALRTSREFGCGLAQFTIAYNANGSVRFNALEETKALDKSLSGWTLKDCYNERYQLRAVTLKLKLHAKQCDSMMIDSVNALKCAGGMYNGGAGSVAKRQRLCRAKAGCDFKVWDNHLDKQCPQSNAKVEGYGESFCQINSKYPGRVFQRMIKFKGYLG